MCPVFMRRSCNSSAVISTCSICTRECFYYLVYVFTVYDVQELVIEKETRIRESMLMMGLRQWVLWASWFIKQLLFMSVWVLAFPILMKVCYSTARMYVYIIPI